MQPSAPSGALCRIDYAEFASRFKVVFSKVRDDNSDYLPSARLRQEAKTSDLVLPSPHAGQSADFRLRLPSPPPDDRIAVDAWTHSALAKVGRALFRGGLGSNTAAVFSRIDRNGDGLLSKDEFTAALKDKDLGLGFSDAEIGKILGVVDANASGNINYIEFVQAFKVADVGSVPVGALSPSWTPPPRDGSGGGGASSGGGGASSSALPSGRRTTREPVVAASGELSARSGRSWQRGVVEQIVSKLFEYRVELAAAFRMFDLDGNGVISREEFRQGLQALTGLLGSPITDMQADEMLRVLDKDGDG